MPMHPCLSARGRRVMGAARGRESQRAANVPVHHRSAVASGRHVEKDDGYQAFGSAMRDPSFTHAVYLLPSRGRTVDDVADVHERWETGGRGARNGTRGSGSVDRARRRMFMGESGKENGGSPAAVLVVLTPVLAGLGA